MSYFINVLRVPKPGQFTAVQSGVEESVRASGHLGDITT
jgi:hypothetical protein